MNNDNERLFRKESLEKISSPDQLDEYLKVTNPAMWLVFLGVIIFLSGVLVWAVWGHLDTEISAAAEVKENTAYIYLPSGKNDIKTGMLVKIRDQEYEISAIHPSSRRADENFHKDLKALGSLESGQILDEIVFPCPISDGVYPAVIVTERISPFRLIFN